MSILDDIGRAYRTDKASGVHDYCRKYEKYLPFKRNDNLKIFEIGVLGGLSLKMWKDYFYNSHILGIDIVSECKKYEEERISIEIGSQIDENFLQDICKTYGTFDMILDDGSHINSDVIFTFQHLFDYVKSGGVYVIEDTCTSYWKNFGGECHKQGTTIEYFKNIIDEVNFFGEYSERIHPETKEIVNTTYRRDAELLEEFKRKGYNYIGTSIESLNFLNSIIIITKR